MQLPEICIKRPVLATVLSLVIVLLGLISYTRLSVREYPRIDEPTISVSVTYRGASAEVVESQVTKPLEDSLAGIEGVEVMTSQSRSESARINVRFTLKRDPDSAAADVRDKVARARGKLPDTIDEPIIAKVEADSQPVIYIAVEAGSLSPLEASDYVKRYIQPRLSVLPGAADVRIFGERQVSMRVNLDRSRLAGYKLTVQDVEDAIRRQNAEIPAGRIESQSREFTVVAETDLRSAEEFNNIIIANIGGYPVRLRDVGSAAIGAISERSVSRYNGKPSLNIGVIKQAVANPLELSKAVYEEVALINPGLPPGMKLVVAYDTSVFIDRSITSVFTTIGEAILLVVLVIFFFLRSLRATIIPIVTIPVSLVGAFALMYVFGFTINTLTLLAMVLAIGLVVDDAIVMLENIFRHIEEGIPRRQAAIQGAREIGFAVVAMTLTLASVFAPLAFATGRTGRLFIEFALTLAGAVHGLRLRRTDADADDVLAAAAPRGEALVDLQLRRARPDRGDERVPAPADGRAARPVAGRAAVARHGRAGGVLLHAAEVGARPDRGSRRRVRPRHRAAGLDAASTRPTRSGRSSSSTRRFPRRRPSRRSPASRPSSTATRCCG